MTRVSFRNVDFLFLKAILNSVAFKIYDTLLPFCPKTATSLKCMSILFCYMNTYNIKIWTVCFKVH